MTSSLAAHWEFTFKTFADRIGVNVFRKDPNQGVQTVNLGAIKTDFEKKFLFLNCNIPLVKDIRDSLIHGNLFQLREILTPHLTPSQLKELETGTFVLSLKPDSADKIQMAGEIKIHEKAKEVGLFFWFLSQGNSRLLDFASDFLEKGIGDLRMASHLFACCEGGHESQFEDLAAKGLSWSEDLKNSFLIKNRALFPSDKAEAKKYLDEILCLFGNS